jgi:hypothetical protein
MNATILSNMSLSHFLPVNRVVGLKWSVVVRQHEVGTLTATFPWVRRFAADEPGVTNASLPATILCCGGIVIAAR